MLRVAGKTLMSMILSENRYTLCAALRVRIMLLDIGSDPLKQGNFPAKPAHIRDFRRWRLLN